MFFYFFHIKLITLLFAANTHLNKIHISLAIFPADGICIREWLQSKIASEMCILLPDALMTFACSPSPPDICRCQSAATQFIFRNIWLLEENTNFVFVYVFQLWFEDMLKPGRQSYYEIKENCSAVRLNKIKTRDLHKDVKVSPASTQNDDWRCRIM